jgi:hypothetical protein
MRFFYSVHANDSLNERKIPKSLIEQTILSPDKVLSSTKGRKIAQKTFSHRLLRVVYKQTENTYIVITAYYTKAGRY